MENKTIFQFISEPSDVNYGGNVHGGSVMKWIDQAGYACATAWASSYCVTVYVGGIRFYSPIKIGHIVKVEAEVIYTGTSSMHIAINVFSRNIKRKDFEKKTHCIIVFVAVDDEGNKVEVPKFVAETESEKQMEQYAIKLMDLRKQIEDEMKPFLYKLMNFNLPFFKLKKFGLTIFALSICFASCSCEKTTSKKTVESTIKTKKHNERFLVYEVNPKKVNLKFYWKDNKNRVIGSLENLKNFVEAKNERLKFAMNGGMFAENQIPKGLYIENFKVLEPIDTLSGEGNFYLKPNGIFIINKDKSSSIVTTENFKINSEINYATQSGPMLLINGKISEFFQKNSTNLNIRNVVGIREDGSLVFAMSKNKVNFYEFANFFKSRNCINALYLDGFVSRVYLPEESWTQKDGNFGVIIGISE